MCKVILSQKRVSGFQRGKCSNKNSFVVSLQLLSHCWHYWRFKIFRLFLWCSFEDFIYLFICLLFAPILKGTVENYPSRAQSEHYKNTLLNGKYQPGKPRRKMSPIHHGDTAEGQERDVWFSSLWQQSFNQQFTATLHGDLKGNWQHRHHLDTQAQEKMVREKNMKA